MQVKITQGEDGSHSVIAFANGELYSAGSTHPNFKAILGACMAVVAGEEGVDESEIPALFDVATTITRKFERLSTRVTVENNQIMFDGDPAQPGLSNAILRFMDEGEDFEPLVNFLEKVMDNPQEDSRAQAWEWFNKNDITVTEDGEVVIYKGVYSDGAGGYRSGFRGQGHIQHADGTEEDFTNAHLPYAIGDTVTMPRSAVAHDPHAACRVGLHVGTYNYASTYAHGAMLRCLVNPRDVVSVPHGSGGQKIRVCRFYIDDIITGPETAPVYRPAADVGFRGNGEAAAAAEFKPGDCVTVDDFGVDYDGEIVSGPDEDGDYLVRMTEDEETWEDYFPPENITRV